MLLWAAQDVGGLDVAVRIPHRMQGLEWPEYLAQQLHAQRVSSG